MDEDWWMDIIHSDGFKPPESDMASRYDLTQLNVSHSGFDVDLKMI